MKIENFFDSETMSVHLRENYFPLAKKGFPGNWKIVTLGKDKLSQEDIKSIADEIVNSSEHQEDCFIEIERAGSAIIQMGVYRIVITKKPFSDGYEITAVRPVKKLTFSDYQLDEKLQQRLIEQSKGVLVAGSPGEGKTTFARALAEHFAETGLIVKTVESPRDMLLSDNITQYSLTYADHDEIRDVLLLTRPDKTFFDEMRNKDDFSLFADLRLAGIGMTGIVHATAPIDGIQRFIGKIEMGIIPQVIDTVVFVKHGQIDKILELKMIVKVPTGMMEADLSRPVVEVRDFISGKLDYEIYSYGDHTVVIPVEKTVGKVSWQFAADNLVNYFKKYSKSCNVEFISDEKIVVFIQKEKIPGLIGPNGKEISKVEKELGLKIDVREFVKTEKGLVYDVDLEKKNILIYLEKKMSEQTLNIYDGEDLLLQAKASKKAIIKLSRKSALGKAVEQAIKNESFIVSK
jgi:ATPase